MVIHGAFSYQRLKSPPSNTGLTKFINQNVTFQRLNLFVQPPAIKNNVNVQIACFQFHLQYVKP